jgi:hypothetical protein
MAGIRVYYGGPLNHLSFKYAVSGTTRKQKFCDNKMGGAVDGSGLGFIMLVDFDCMSEMYTQVYEMVDTNAYFSDHNSYSPAPIKVR